MDGVPAGEPGALLLFLSLLLLCIRLLDTSHPVDVLDSSPGRKRCSGLQVHFEISATTDVFPPTLTDQLSNGLVFASRESFQDRGNWFS